MAIKFKNLTAGGSGGSAKTEFTTLAGTTVPNDGTVVEKVYFNTTLSVDEVVNIIKNNNLTIPTDDIYVLIIDTTNFKVICFQGDDTNGYMIMYMELANEIQELLFTSVDVGLGFVGWNTDLLGTNNYKEFNIATVNEFEGMLVGAENEKINGIVSIENNFENVTFSKELNGTYDGSTIIQDMESETMEIDIESMLVEKKLPFKIALNNKIYLNTVEYYKNYCSQFENFIRFNITSLQEDFIKELTTIQSGMFMSRYNISYDFSNVTSVEKYGLAFNSMTNIDLPNVTYLGANALYECSQLETINIPNITGMSNDAFTNCSNLKSLKMPKLTSCSRLVNCQKLEVIDLGVSSQIHYETFSKFYSLKTIIFRNTTAVITQYNGTSIKMLKDCCHFTGEVDSTYNPNGDKDGCIYVPDNLVDSYKADSVWSNYADLIKPLSEYVEE